MALTLISDDETRVLKDQAASVLDIRPGEGAFFRAEFLRQRRWGAVIFEGDFHDIDGSMSKHARMDAGRKIYCVGLADYMGDAYAIEPLHADFAEVRKKYLEPSYLITDKVASFAIVSDSDYYWAIATDSSRLVSRYGESVAGHLNDFDADASAYMRSGVGHDAKIGNMLRDYLGICRESCRSIGLFDTVVPEPIIG